MADETKPLLSHGSDHKNENEYHAISPDSHQHYKVYGSRWYICFVFTIFCVMQSSMWNFYSPIQDPLKLVYGWSDNFIEWLGNAANITFCVLVVPLAAWVDSRGMRVPLILTVVALCFNSGLRCIPVGWVGQTAYAGVSMTSMIFNGIAGTVETLSPPVLSSLWFPVHERATATAIMATANTLGTAVGFVTAFVVPSDGTESDINTALTRVYWGMFGICLATLVSTIVYFPDQPPTPPAASCSVPKVAIRQGLLQLVRHGRFWVVVMCMALPLGVYSAWLNVLDLNLQNFNFSQDDAGWVGFGSAVAGAAAGVLTGRIADRFPGRLTRILGIMYLLSSVLMLWFALICVETIPFSLPSVYTSSILFGFCMYGTYPLFFELCVETTFPIPEGCTAGFLVMAQAVIQALFLAIPVDQVGSAWMNWTLCACPLFFAAVLFMFRDEYARLRLDIPATASAKADLTEGRVN